MRAESCFSGFSVGGVVGGVSLAELRVVEVAQHEYVLRWYSGRSIWEAEAFRSWRGQRLSGRKSSSAVRDESSRGGTSKPGVCEIGVVQ